MATKQARYYRRHRKISICTGSKPDGTAALSEPVSALITRYRYGLKRRKPHYVYYHGGTWYRARNEVTALDGDGKPCAWEWALEPLDGVMAYDTYSKQTEAEGLPRVKLTFSKGRALATGVAGPYKGAPLLDGTEPPDYVEELLGLASVKRRKQEPEPEQERPAYVGKHFKSAA